MVKTTRDVFQRDGSYDEPDRVPRDITITNFDILMYVIAIISYFVDLAIDVNIAVRYFYSNMMTEFGWTVAFIVLPAFINTGVSMRMYSLDVQKEHVLDELPKGRYTRHIFLILQMAPILRLVDALVYALKSRRAERKGDRDGQLHYYKRMLSEDADVAMLRIFECFLEAAPQQVLQTCLLFRGIQHLAVHQLLSICSSILSMGWSLAAYQRAIRFSQQDKLNMDWIGSAMQTVSHFLITFSRVLCIAVIAYIAPLWTIIACCIHILIMATWLELFDRSPFCSQSKIAEIAFSLALGAVYLFTYILPVEGRTRYRYMFYYTICFFQNIACGVIWLLYVDESIMDTKYFYPIFGLCIVPFCVGLIVMVSYYAFRHPRVRRPLSFMPVKFSDNPVSGSIM